MKKQYLVKVQQKWQAKEGNNEYWNLARLMGGINKTFYTSLETAMIDLKKYVEDCNRGARTERTVVNGIGIDFVVDAESAADDVVVDWKIQVREVTPWETVAEMEK